MDLSRIVLVCPRNDAESALIHLVATAIGMRVITSTQGIGATLENEPALEHLILLSRAKEAWIVEIPGPETEARLTTCGVKVVVIDHHTYNGLDRVTGPDGHRRRSSLEQFVNLACAGDDRLYVAACYAAGYGMNPTIVRGIGVLDDRYAQGLRDEGYSPGQIREVLVLREALIRSMNVSFDSNIEAARLAWDKRETRGDYTVVRATDRRGVRGEVGILTIADDCDTRPLIV